MLLSVFISLLIWHVALFGSYSFIISCHVTLYDFFHNSYIKKIWNYTLYTREWTLERKEKEKGKEKEWINKIEWNCQNNYAQDFTSSLSSFFIFLLFIRSSLFTRGHCNPPLFKDGVNKSLSFFLSLSFLLSFFLSFNKTKEMLKHKSSFHSYKSNNASSNTRRSIASPLNGRAVIDALKETRKVK